jgi:hypothetical protein
MFEHPAAAGNGQFSLISGNVRMTGNLDLPEGRSIVLTMTKVLTIRLDPDLLGKAEARAADMGLDRAKYVRTLIEEDLAAAAESPPRKFASEDLAGIYEGTGEPATNSSTRTRLKNRATGKP